jgi:multicomponent Na+:H+ antiporter subunit G
MLLIYSIITLTGSAFLFLGALGIIRMPDVYNRMQAGTKATTLGSILFLLGIGLAMPGWIVKIIVLIFFIIFTNPVSTNAMASAAHKCGIKLTEKTQKDHLSEDCKGDDEHE